MLCLISWLLRIIGLVNTDNFVKSLSYFSYLGVYWKIKELKLLKGRKLHIYIPNDNKLERICDNKQNKTFYHIENMTYVYGSIKYADRYGTALLHIEYWHLPSPSHIVLEGLLITVCVRNKYYSFLVLNCVVLK